MNKVIKLLIFALPFIVSCTHKELEVRVESVTMSLPSAELEIGKTLQLNATVSPSTATRKEITWSSSQSSVASVSSSGLVTAVSEGTTTITATADGKKGECTVSVVKGFVAVSEIKLGKTELTLYEGEEETLTASVLPDNATDKTITWTTSDKSIASVESGKVKAIKEGIATITASAGTIKSECNVTVLMKYGEVAITDLKPVDILPVIGQVVEGDKQAYDHIEHLRLAEATRIRDMMSKYGAGKHSAEEYQQLMGRLVVGMGEECPSLSESFEVVGRGFTDLATWETAHSHSEWSILNSIVPNTRRIVSINGFYHADFPLKTENPDQIDWINMASFLDANPNSIVILGCSAYVQNYRKDLGETDFQRIGIEDEEIVRLCRDGRLIIFRSGGNIHGWYGTLINKCLHKDVLGDEHGMYSLQSLANGKNNAVADMALLVTVGTNAVGDVDQSNEDISSSLFPVGFHDKVLFAGRAFPKHELTEGYYIAEGYPMNNGKYVTSFTNYVNTTMMGVCFQMYAEAKDVFELLDMVRSTCLTDYIRLDGETQPLQLINPAGLYKKYLTPQNLPTTISAEETVTLDKGYYKGVLFSIPGAQVKINGEWVAFDNKNKDLILSQNPMTMEWRLNGELLKRYGYSSGQTVEGKIITVDDKWGGLRLEVPMTIRIQ